MHQGRATGSGTLGHSWARMGLCSRGSDTVTYNRKPGMWFQAGEFPNWGKTRPRGSNLPGTMRTGSVGTTEPHQVGGNTLIKTPEAEGQICPLSAVSIKDGRGDGLSALDAQSLASPEGPPTFVCQPMCPLFALSWGCHANAPAPATHAPVSGCRWGAGPQPGNSPLPTPASDPCGAPGLRDPGPREQAPWAHH